MEHQHRLDLNSLLLAFESDLIAIYDMQRADADPEDFLGIDLQASIAKRKANLERIRERILNFCDNPYSSWERVEELLRVKEGPE